MRLPGSIEKLWKKIQGDVYYEIVKWVFLIVVAAMSPFFIHVLQSVRHAPQVGLANSLVLGVLIFCALLLTVIFFRGARASGPNLVLSLGNLVWTYRSEDDLTVFFILASLVNKGEPSVALGWEITYRVGTSAERGEMHNIMGSYALEVDKTRITFTNENLLNLKTLETPIQKGQSIGGRILFTIPGNRTAQIASIQHTIEIACTDYLGHTTKAKYTPSAKPPKSLLVHPTEKTESLKQEVVKSASVSYAQEPPSLGAGTKPQ